jgi:hypothetical protein
MSRRWPVLVSASLWLITAWGCGPQPDITTVKLVPQISGYHFAGIVPAGEQFEGQNRILPTVTFQLKNEGTLPVDYVDITVAFWPAGADSDKDSKLIHAIGKAPLQPGATSDTMTVQSDVGFSSPLAPAEFFTSRFFVDFKVKVFARRSGSNASLGEITVERRVLPSASKDGPHQ